VKSAVKLLLHYLSVSVRSQMQYKTSFAISLVAQFFLMSVELVAIWALFARFGTLATWTLPEVAFLYGMSNMAFAISETSARGFDIFGSRVVKQGNFDWILLRPRSTALQVAGLEFRLRYLGRLLQGACVLIWAMAKLGIVWTAAKALLAIFAIFGGACMFSGLFVIQAVISFWTTESLEIFNTVTYGGAETAQYPLSIYRDWFRKFFTFVIPLACLNYFPALAILGRTDPSGASPLIQWMSPVFGVFFLLVTLQFWKFGVRHYRSTGS